MLIRLARSSVNTVETLMDEVRISRAEMHEVQPARAMTGGKTRVLHPERGGLVEDR